MRPSLPLHMKKLRLPSPTALAQQTPGSPCPGEPDGEVDLDIRVEARHEASHGIGHPPRQRAAVRREQGPSSTSTRLENQKSCYKPAWGIRTPLLQTYVCCIRSRSEADRDRWCNLKAGKREKHVRFYIRSLACADSSCALPKSNQPLPRYHSNVERWWKT